VVPLTSGEQPGDTRFERALVLAGIVVLAFNLRPGAVSVGPVLEEVTGALDMSPTTAGVLTAAPVLCFSAFGWAAPAAARVVGLHRLTLLALVAAVAGLGVRATTGSIAVFLVTSVVALAGLASGNVLLPSMVKLHFPDHVGVVTGLYTTSMAFGLTLSSALTVPIAEAAGTWRWGLGSWALVVAVSALPWLGLLRHDAHLAKGRPAISVGDVARTRLGWAMAAVFGLQSLQAYAVFGWFAQVYRDAGFTAPAAGLFLGVATGVGIPLSFVIPMVGARMRDQTWLMLALLACYPVGYLGLAFAPEASPLLWAVLVGVATSIFPLVLAQISLRCRTSEGTAALSGFSQSVGYLLAAVGPLGVGVLYEARGGWTIPLLALTGAALLLAVLCPLVARPSYLEDQLRRAGG
jgi:CP family cyanate transporter-like MFS transporter